MATRRRWPAAAAGRKEQPPPLTAAHHRCHDEAYFRTLRHNTCDVVLVLDQDNRILAASPSAARLLDRPDLDGTTLTDLVPPPDHHTTARSLAHMRVRGHHGTHDRWQMLRGDGTSIEVEVSCDDRGAPRPGELVLTLADATEQHNLDSELTRRALRDPLTGLVGPALFQDRVEHALTHSQREGTVVAVILLDMDDLKAVNDTHGHSVGDELLVAVSLRLAATLRASDTVARIGGDGFALLLEDSVAPADVEAVADRVMSAFAEPFPLSAGPVRFCASVGVATTEDSQNAAELLEHADVALSEAKAAGGRRWRAAGQPSTAEWLERQVSLDRALAGSSLKVLYQPIVELADGDIAGFEALVRWPHATRGTVFPEQFLPSAEESGQILPLGAWVLDQATCEAARWRRITFDLSASARDRPSPYVSVNVSPRQFRDPGFVQTVRRSLEQSGISPGSLVLELTESILTRRDDHVSADMETLTALGVRIAIDNFGTGYSSLSRLRGLPISMLKIDKSFIEQLGHSRQQYTLVEGIIRMAQTLGVEVIATGIENASQQLLLISMGCPLGQGYMFSRPITSDQAESLTLATPGDTLTRWLVTG